jgi:hypothetical protein
MGVYIINLSKNYLSGLGGKGGVGIPQRIGIKQNGPSEV